MPNNNCTACNQAITYQDYLKCSVEKCANRYHYECLGIARSAYIKITAKQKASWRCLVCTQPKERKSDSTPVRPAPSTQQQTSQLVPTTVTSIQAKDTISAQPNIATPTAPPGASVSTTLPEPPKNLDAASSAAVIQSSHADLHMAVSENNERLIAQLSKLIDEKLGENSIKLLEKQEAIIKQYNSMIESLEKYGQLYDDTIRDITALQSEMKDVKKVKEEVVVLRSTIEELQTTINNMEQRDRLCNLEVFGVPERKSEVVGDVVVSIAKAVGVPLECADMVSASRIPTRNNSGLAMPIIIKFKSLNKRDEFLTAVRKNRGVKTSEIGMPGDPSPIHVNEHLTPANKALLKETKLRIKELGFRYCWTRNGKIFVRQEDNYPPFRTDRKSQLNVLKKSNIK